MTLTLNNSIMYMEIMSSYDSENTGQIWYLGYGSNMQSSVMAKKGLKVFQAANFIVGSHILNFDVLGYLFQSLQRPEFPSGRQTTKALRCMVLHICCLKQTITRLSSRKEPELHTER